jgi:hypothetical protein
MVGVEHFLSRAAIAWSRTCMGELLEVYWQY